MEYFTEYFYHFMYKYYANINQGINKIKHIQYRLQSLDKIVSTVSLDKI